LKKLTVFFVILVISLIFTGCQKYDPVDTLQATVKVSVYFSPDPHDPCYDWYKGRRPDPEKHRQVVYQVTVTNTGKRNKSFILVDPILDSSFKKLVINECLGIPGAVAPGKTVTLDKVTYLIEGTPAEVERLAYQSKVRIVWEEGGKKWEKVVSVAPER
jgi:hypothetical protein